MSPRRAIGTFLATLLLAASVGACSKKSDDQMSQSMPEQNPAVAAESTVAMTPQAPPETPATPPAATTTKPAPKTTPKPKTAAAPAVAEKSISLPAGTEFEVELVTPIKTDSSSVGDKIEGKLLAPLVAEDMVIAKQGAAIRGEITELVRASKDKSEEGRASVKLAFTSLETVDGEKSLDATVTNVTPLQASGTTKRDALMIGGGAALGAVLGKVIGKDTKGAVIGAVAGAAVGTGGVLLSKGHELNLPAGSKITLKSEQPVTIVQK
jgi:hypothetical protein